MENYKSWEWNREKENELVSNDLLPLKKAFEDALVNLPEQHRVRVGGEIIDGLWDTVYRSHWACKEAVMKNGMTPNVSRRLLSHQRVRNSGCGGQRRKSEDYRAQYNEGLERLAMLQFHHCALKQNHPQESAFSQAVRTILMSGSVPLGNKEDWDYLADRKIEPVQYRGKPLTKQEKHDLFYKKLKLFFSTVIGRIKHKLNPLTLLKSLKPANIKNKLKFRKLHKKTEQNLVSSDGLRKLKTITAPEIKSMMSFEQSLKDIAPTILWVSHEQIAMNKKREQYCQAFLASCKGQV
jgi:hypothetical protein